MRAAAWLAAWLAAGAGAGLPAQPGTGENHVHVQDYEYLPNSLNIVQGESVAWDNHGNEVHTVTADDGGFDSGELQPGGSFTRAFGASGSFGYHCRKHEQMTGRIVVSKPAMPDLVVASLQAPDEVPGVWKRVEVKVRNLGLADAGASEARVSYRHQGEEWPVGDASVPALAPGASAEVEVRWLVLGKVGDFRVLALADSAGQVEEEDEGNNLGAMVSYVLLQGMPGIDLLDPVAGGPGPAPL